MPQCQQPHCDECLRGVGVVRRTAGVLRILRRSNDMKRIATRLGAREARITKALEVINNKEHIGVTILVSFAPALSAHTPAHGQERLARIRESRQRLMKTLRGLLLGFAMFTSGFATALIADVQAKSQDEATI